MTAERRTSIDRVGVEILEGLHQHRLLSSSQLHALYSPGHPASRTRALTAELSHWRLVSYVRARARGGEKLWFLTDRGADAIDIAAIKGTTRKTVITPQSAAGQLQAHTLAVNDVGIAFVLTARQHQHDCGPLAWRHEITHPISAGRARSQPGETVRADALLQYAVLEKQVTLISRFIELDRATMPMDDLVAKLRRYARMARFSTDGTQPAWTEHYRALPEVLVVFGGKPRALLERRLRTLCALAREDPLMRLAAHEHAFSISFALLDDLRCQGALAPVFVRWSDPGLQINLLGDPAT